MNPKLYSLNPAEELLDIEEAHLRFVRQRLGPEGDGF